MNENESSLNQIFNDVADSIRAKLGTQAGIKPVDFSDNIDNITGGIPTKNDVGNYLKGQLEGIALTPLFTNSDLEVTRSYGNGMFDRYQEPYKSSGSYDWYNDNLRCEVVIFVENNSEYNYVIYYNDDTNINDLYKIESGGSNELRFYINPETYNNNKLIIMKEEDIQKSVYLVNYNNGEDEAQYHVEVMTLGQTRLGTIYIYNEDLTNINYDPDDVMFLYTLNTNTVNDNPSYWVGSKNEVSQRMYDNKCSITTYTGNSINDFIYGYLTLVGKPASSAYSDITVKVYDTVQEQYIDIQKPNLKFIDVVDARGCSERGIFFSFPMALSNEVINNKTYLISHISFETLQTNLTLRFTVNVDGINYIINKNYVESPVNTNTTVSLDLNSYIPNLLSINNVTLSVNAYGGQPAGTKYLTVTSSGQDINVSSVEVHNYDNYLYFEFENTTNSVVKAYSISIEVYDENDQELLSDTMDNVILNKNGAIRADLYCDTNLYDDASKVTINFSEISYTDINMTYIGSHTGLVEEMLCYAPTNYVDQTGLDYEILVTYSNNSEYNYTLDIRYDDDSEERQHTLNISSGSNIGTSYWSNTEPENFECTVTTYSIKDIPISIIDDQTSNIVLSYATLTSYGELEFNIKNEDDYNANLHLDTLYLADTNELKLIDVDDSQFIFISNNSNVDLVYRVDNFTQNIYNNTEWLMINTVEYMNKTQSLTLVNTNPTNIQFNNITLDLEYNEIEFEVENTSNDVQISYSIKLYDSNDNAVYYDPVEYVHTIYDHASDTYYDGIYSSFEDLGIIPTKIELVDYREINNED